MSIHCHLYLDPPRQHPALEGGLSFPFLLQGFHSNCDMPEE